MGKVRQSRKEWLISDPRRCPAPLHPGFTGQLHGPKALVPGAELSAFVKEADRSRSAKSMEGLG
jgi:hypothetical protein